MSLGNMLRRAREASGLSVRQMARAIKRSPSFVSRVENGHDTPGEDAAIMWARRIDLDEDELLRQIGCLPADIRRAIFAPGAFAKVRKALGEKS